MKGMVLTMAVLTTTVMLAGCTQDTPSTFTPTTGTDLFSQDLQEGKGAIQGLLIDDRYRPIQNGEVLLQELGQTTTSNANGEFVFLDIEPGTYTLKVTAEGHEAAPASVVVVIGEWAEAHVIARRILDAGSFIYTQQFTVFQFCSINVVLPLTDACNALDQSGDSGRASVAVDLSAIEGVTAVVSELKADNPGDYELWIGQGMATLEAKYYAQEFINGDYGRCLNQVGNISDCNDKGLASAFSANGTLEYIVWFNGMLDDETAAITLGIGYGIGAHVAAKAKVVVSAFIGEPEEDLDTYCVLC